MYRYKQNNGNVILRYGKPKKLLFKLIEKWNNIQEASC